MTQRSLILIGSMGAGKTTIGRRLGRALGLEFVDLDQRIVSESGAPITLIFDLEGEEGFREREHRALVATLADGPVVLATGGGAVLREDNRALIRTHGFTVYLQIDVGQQWRRLRRDRSRPLLRASDPLGRLRELASVRDPIYESLADMVFPASDDHIGRVVHRLQNGLPALWRDRVAAPSPAPEPR